MKFYLVLVSLLFSFQVFANIQKVISPLAVSSKGQYVLLEEYGYIEETNSFYSKVKLFNSWKNEYIGEEIILEEVATYPSKLLEVRSKMKLVAATKFKEFPVKF
jgi:hypothetical protein